MEQEVRLHKFYNIDRKSAAQLFIPFDKGITVDAAIPIHSGMIPVTIASENLCK